MDVTVHKRPNRTRAERLRPPRPRARFAAFATAPAPDTTEITSPPVAVARAKNGSSEAFSEIYAQNVDQVRRVLRNRMSGPALKDLDDLVQEVFTRAWKAISGFEWQGKDIGAWLTVIACNLVRDHHKSAFSRHVTLSHEPVSPQRPCQEPSPHERFVQSTDRAALSAAFAELTARQRECLFLRFYADMSVGETGEVMGLTNGAVKALHYRAIQALARLIPADHAPDES
ncbi:RNA polymerase sigma factor [Actinorhabdospora filicis]|uniref:RNA polymerase sigma factor n=1 Tax=Actinorhabdospora filicis TaxID=1785913 RepID=A0A9W6SP55_9ACTN|nr:sigma-70 family RNA polymerase sigma factor [Actinorhabdospora filicis]GLZ78176.1 RNA polymerase sigma factor [Actinorhabdospora filicis]